MDGGHHHRFILREANILHESGDFREGLDVLVENGRTLAVQPNLQDDAAASFDFSGTWLLPGIFDCHDHVTFSSLDAMELMRTPLTQWALESSKHLRETLRHGITFVRDASGADLGIKESIERGYVEGPSLQISVIGLTQTGGHFDGFLYGPGLEMSADYVFPDLPGRPKFRVDGKDEMRKAVREILRAGADWIKLCATGGIASPYDDSDAPEFTEEELQTAVDEAASKGRPVMAHAFGGRGLDNALAAGVRSVEHGVLMSEEQAVEMARRGAFLVPTLGIMRDVIKWAEEGLLPEYATRKALELKPRLGNSVQLAKDAGVKMAVGTDFVLREQHGRNLTELALMGQAGLSAEEVLQAATINGAELCGVADRYGRIDPGFIFDAVVVDEDPSSPSIFEDPEVATGVFKSGRAVRRHERLDNVLIPG